MKNSKTQRTGFAICFMTAVLSVTLIFLSAVSSGQSELADSTPQTIKLSEPKLDGPLSLEQTLSRRRSIRRFSSRQISFDKISQLAWAGQGITEKQRGLRTAPSAGAIYPIELYVAIPQGFFIYRPHNHSLEKVINSDIRKKLSEASLGQRSVADAGVDIIIAGSEKKLAARYGDRAKTFMLLEAGHIAQNILLQAVSLDLGGVPVGAYDIDAVGKVCKLPKKLQALYIIPIGYPADREEK